MRVSTGLFLASTHLQAKREEAKKANGWQMSTSDGVRVFSGTLPFHIDEGTVSTLEMVSPEYSRTSELEKISESISS